LTDARKAHWDQVYAARLPDEVSWYQPVPIRSLEFIRATGEPLTTPIIDVGGGASTLVDQLLLAGYSDISVLDIAAGHGLFGIHVAKKSPAAEIHAVDWPAVLEVARENAESAGVSKRLNLIPGSAFEVEFGDGYDVALLTNFFHHFDKATCVGLMKKVHRALRPGGRALTLEFVPNDDRVTPPQPGAFAFIMLNTTPSGDAYTFTEYQEMFREAGFEKSEVHQPPGLPQSVIQSHK